MTRAVPHGVRWPRPSVREVDASERSEGFHSTSTVDDSTENADLPVRQYRLWPIPVSSLLEACSCDAGRPGPDPIERRKAYPHAAGRRVKSFLNSDIIAETTDGEGETTYLAVETSFTGDLHDADRARSHATLVQRLTGKPCRAIIASSQKNTGLTKLIDRGEIAWHELRIRIQPAG